MAAQIDWVKVTGSAEAVTPAARWTKAGISHPKLDAKDFVTGQHKYVSDTKLPGMLYGKVLRAPSFGAKLVAADCASAAKMPGVQVVRDGDFVGVAAANEQIAEKALSLIQAKWNEVSQPAKREPSYSAAGAGSQDVTQVESSYSISYIAHVPLEPRAAVAKWNGEKLSVLTGTQVPFGVRSNWRRHLA